jgi:hypothetical protein
MEVEPGLVSYVSRFIYACLLFYSSIAAGGDYACSGTSPDTKRVTYRVRLAGSGGTERSKRCLQSYWSYSSCWWLARCLRGPIVLDGDMARVVE